MPANTAKGWPYPVGTDRVADGDDAIKALAEKLDALLGYGIAAGSVVINMVTAGTPVSVAVTLPVGRFGVAPVLSLTNYTGGNPQSYSPPAGGGVSASGFNIIGNRPSNTGSYTVHWVAVAPTQ